MRGIYLSTPEFKDMDGDRRKIYVVGLTIDAYGHLQNLRHAAGLVSEGKPSFISALEDSLACTSHGQQGKQGKKRRRESAASSSLHTSEETPGLLTPWTGELEYLPGMPIHFEDIDWLFESLPSEYQLADLSQSKSFNAGEFQFENT